MLSLVRKLILSLDDGFLLAGQLTGAIVCLAMLPLFVQHFIHKPVLRSVTHYLGTNIITPSGFVCVTLLTVETNCTSGLSLRGSASIEAEH